MSQLVEFPEEYVYPAVGRCIYCGNTAHLSDEHIIPYSLNGRLILPKASCESCRRITQRFETKCTKDNGHMFYSLRVRLGMQSRSGSTDADKIATYVVNPDGTRQLEHFPADDLPVLLFRWNFPIAGILEGRDPSEASKKRVTISVPPEDPSAPTRIGDSVKNAGGMVQVGKFHPAPFFRMVAKIGYAYTAATIGTEYLLPEVADIILGKSDRFLHFIGGGIVFDGPALPVTPLHLVAANNRVYGDDVFKVALVQLFAQFGSPPLHVVVAKRQNN